MTRSEFQWRLEFGADVDVVVRNTTRKTSVYRLRKEGTGFLVVPLTDEARTFGGSGPYMWTVEESAQAIAHNPNLEPIEESCR